MSYETLLTELSEGVATITVNRPSAMNAMTTAPPELTIPCVP